jgi:hypothetical protein
VLNDHHFAVTFYHVLGRKAWAFDREPMHRHAPGAPEVRAEGARLSAAQEEAAALLGPAMAPHLRAEGRRWAAGGGRTPALRCRASASYQVREDNYSVSLFPKRRCDRAP